VAGVATPTVSRPHATLRVRLLTAGTSLRIVLVPVLMALILADGPGGEDTASLVAASIFIVAAGTDFLDGYLARKWSVTTTLGSFLDTTADKLLVSGTLVALVAVERVSPWVCVIIIGRELVIMGLRGAVAADGTVMKPSLLGKWKTTVQFAAIALALLRLGDPVGGLFIDEWVMLLAAAITLASAVHYLSRFASSFTEPE
jgi:CDP-diacylglycerol--glycerol-3-phosphate 3-phosphatidyltransferase